MPIVKAYAQKIGLVETVDRMVGLQMQLSPGMAVLGMVLDTLSGRTPLYRLTEFFEEKDTELLTNISTCMAKHGRGQRILLPCGCAGRNR